ncbi:peptidase U32 family protein [Methanocaldococcus sp.]
MFSIPHPGDFESLKVIVNEIKKIKKYDKRARKERFEIYLGFSEFIGTGRATLHKPNFEELEEQIRYAKKNNLRMEVVINASCLGGTHLTANGISYINWIFNQLRSIGVECVALSDPYLVDLAKNNDLDVNVSCIALVDCLDKALFWDEKEVYAITLDSSINRHFDIIQEIKDNVNCKLKILVNEACLYKCPMRTQHFNFFSHANAQNIPALDDYYYNKCINLRVKNKELIIKSPFIRPEDLTHYEKMIDIFKISGRSHPIGWIKRVLLAYLKRKWDGNLMELLDCPRELQHFFYLDNKMLNSAIKKWKSCNKRCSECNFCKDLAEKALKVKN